MPLAHDLQAFLMVSQHPVWVITPLSRLLLKYPRFNDQLFHSI